MAVKTLLPIPHVPNELDIQRLLNEVAQDRITRANRTIPWGDHWAMLVKARDNGAGQPDVCPSKAWQGLFPNGRSTFTLAVTGWPPGGSIETYRDWEVPIIGDLRKVA